MLTVKLRHVHEDRDRHGNVRVYFWRGRGFPKIRLREDPGTAASQTEYEAAVERSAKPKSFEPSGKGPPREGTYRWLCAQFFASAEFKGLTETTKRRRRRILEETMGEPVRPGSRETYADYPLHRMTSKAIRVLRDRLSDRPGVANIRHKAVRRLFSWAVEAEPDAVPTNIARDVRYLDEDDSDGFLAWPVEMVRTFEAYWPLGTKPRLALALLLYTGVRRSDVVRLGRQMEVAGWLHFSETKGRKRKLKKREIPVLPQLREAIDAGPAGNLTYLMTEKDRPFSAAGFGNWFAEQCIAAKVAGRAHGLRKAGATIAAERGATEHQLMAIYGWSSPTQAAVYTRKARSRKLAGSAMHLVVPEEGEE